MCEHTHQTGANTDGDTHIASTCANTDGDTHIASTCATPELSVVKLMKHEMTRSKD